jgi:hypothetical protein
MTRLLIIASFAVPLIGCTEESVPDGGTGDGGRERDGGQLPDDDGGPPPVDSGPRPDVVIGDGLLFASDFGTELGTTDRAVTDEDRMPTWCVRGGPETALEVVPRGALAFPMPNVLRVRALLESDGYGSLRIGDPFCEGLPTPAIGESRYYRWYYMHEQPDHPADNGAHPIQDGSAQSTISWEFNTRTLSDTTWHHDYAVQVNSGENPFELQKWQSPTLEHNVVYRFELQILRTGDTTFEMHARTYDSDGALLYDDDDYGNEVGTMTLADTPVLHFHATLGASTLAGLNAGLNGITGLTADVPYSHQAGFCIRSDRWCGPYADGI